MRQLPSGDFHPTKSANPMSMVLGNKGGVWHGAVASQSPVAAVVTPRQNQ